MSNTKQWNRPGDYTLIELTLVLHNGNTLDIVADAVQIELFEDINKAAITGIIIVQDSEGLLEKNYMIGSEKIIFQMTTDFENEDYHTIKKDFRVVKISDFISQGKEQFYTLHITTAITVLNQNVKLSKSYSDYAEKIVENIYKETLRLNTLLLVDETKYPRKLIAPRINPLTFFKYLADTSIDSQSDDDTNTGFTFYESSVGHNFRYLRGLYEDPDAIVLYENGKSVKDERNSLSIIKEAYVKTMYNNMDNQMVGVFGGNVITHDIINKDIVKTEYGYNGTLAPNVTDYSTDNRFSFMSANYNSENSNRWSLNTEKDKQLFDNYNLIIDMYGNSNITVGRVVNYIQESNIITGSEEGEVTQKHKIFPKKHLVTKVKHTFIDGTYTMTLELSSDRWYT